MSQGANMERSAQQRAALLTLWLLVEGPLTVSQVAARLYETNSGAWRLLNELGGVLPVVNDGGYWYVDIRCLSDLRRVFEITGAELAAAPAGTLYARPLKRDDMARIHQIAGELLRVGLPQNGDSLPTGQQGAGIVEREGAEARPAAGG